MFKYNIILFLILNKVSLLNSLYYNNDIQNNKDKEALISTIIDYFNFFDNDEINNFTCIKNLTKSISNYEIIYFSSSLDKNDINTYASCINYNESIKNGNFTYLIVLINQKKSLYNVLTMDQTDSEYLTGLCFINGCDESSYQTILLNIMNKVYDNRENNINNTINLYENANNKNNTNKFSEDDIKIYIFDSTKKNDIFITLLELIPFIIICIHILFTLISSIPIFLINLICCTFCCKKNFMKKFKTKEIKSRISKIKYERNKSYPPINSDRIPSVSTVKSSTENFKKSLEILYNVELHFFSLYPNIKKNQLILSGIPYLNGLKGIFMIFLLFGNVYMGLYGCFITEKNKNNFFSQLNNFLFFFFYVGIRYAPKMLLCAGGFSLYFKFMFFLDGKMDEEVEKIKQQNDENYKEMNSSSNSSNKFFNKLNDKDKDKVILPFKSLFNFYLKQLNKYIIYILFLCFFIFSFNKTVILFRAQNTPLWNFFNEKMIKSSKKVYYLLPLLLGIKSYFIPFLSNNDEINLLDYFYLPFQEIIFFIITTFIIFLGYRNNFRIDRLFKAIGILIFIFRNVYYWIYHLDNKDYFNFHEFGKFFNSMLYNYNFYIIGIFFGMINYILQKGYAERDVELEEKIYLFSTTKVLKSIKRKKRRTLNIISIVNLLIIIILSFFQQIIASYYDYEKPGDLLNYKNNIFSQIIFNFDTDLFVILFYLTAFFQYIKGYNELNNFLCHNFWTVFNNFYFTYILLINPIILYIIYTTDTKIIFNLSNCFLYTFICGFLVFTITIIIYSIFELPLKKLIKYIMNLRENNKKDYLSTIENNREQNFMDNITASITDIIDDEEEEENEEK